MKCVLIFVCDVCCTSKNPLLVGSGVWRMCNTMKTGSYAAWLSKVVGHMLTWAPSMSTTDDMWRTGTFSCWRCQRARHSLGSAQNYLGPTALQRSVCKLGTRETHRWWYSSLYGTVWIFLASIWHVMLIKESSFGAETWLITQNLKPEKGWVIEKLSSFPTSKESGGIVISKENCGKLFWDHKHVLVSDFLEHGDTAECYCGTLSLWWPLFAKGLSYCTKVSSFCMKMPGDIHPTGLTTVHGCTSDRLWISPNLVSSVFSLTESLRSTWLASNCSRCWCEARYHLLATDTQQQCLLCSISLGTTVVKNAKMSVVTKWRSDVYHLLHICYVLIRVTVTFVILQGLLRYFLKVLYVYIAA